MTDIVKLYNPATAAALTQEQVAGLQQLKPDQIKELAKAYPNSSTMKAYLLIIDSKKPHEKQLPQLSTWENLYNLITRNGMKTFVPYGFRGGNNKVVARVGKVRPRRFEVLDLSDTELMTLPGFKSLPAEQVQVTRVKTKQTINSQ